MTVGEYRQLSLSYSSNNLDMEIWCKYAKDVLVGHYFLLAMERMFTLGKNLTQKLDPCFTKGCLLSLGITA